MPGLVFLLTVTVAFGAQSSPAAPSIASELAGKIAAAIAPATELALTISISDADETQKVELGDDLLRGLQARGIRATRSTIGVVTAAITCGRNLREHVCIGEIARPGVEPVIVAVSRPHDADETHTESAPLSLDVARLFGQRAPILDAAVAGDRLFVLDPVAMTLYRRGTIGWLKGESRSVNPPRPWPRDVRGRIRIQSNSVDAFLPGLICRADFDLGKLSCAEDRVPWPLGIDNGGIEASRNFFSTPEGLPFYGVAALDENSRGARWLIANRAGALTFLDASRQAVSAAGRADDVVGLRSACSSNAFVLIASRERGARADALQLFRVVEEKLVPAAPTREMPGNVTALWAAPGSTVATVVTHDSSVDRYEAFQVGIACDR